MAMWLEPASFPEYKEFDFSIAYKSLWENYVSASSMSLEKKLDFVDWIKDLSSKDLLSFIHFE